METSPLPSILLKAVKRVAERRREIPQMAVKWGIRLEFELWLKLELAYELENIGFEVMFLKKRGPERRKAYLTFRKNGLTYHLELKACKPVSSSIRGFFPVLEKVKLTPRPDLGLALLTLLPVNTEANLFDEIKALKYGWMILGEKPVVETIEIDEHVGVALLLFGPYQDGRRLLREAIRGLLRGLTFDEEEIEEAKASLLKSLAGS